MIRRGVSGILDLCLISAISVKISLMVALEYEDLVFLVTYCLLILTKDLFFGFRKSIFKSLFGLSIVNTEGTNPTIIQLVLRNITLIIYPIEIICVLIFKKRLGDYIFKTDVVTSV